MKNIIYIIILLFLLTINAQPIYFLNENTEALTIALALPMLGFLIMADYEDSNEQNTKKQIVLVSTKTISKSVKNMHLLTSSDCISNCR